MRMIWITAEQSIRIIKVQEEWHDKYAANGMCIFAEVQTINSGVQTIKSGVQNRSMGCIVSKLTEDAIIVGQL